MGRARAAAARTGSSSAPTRGPRDRRPPPGGPTSRSRRSGSSAVTSAARSGGTGDEDRLRSDAAMRLPVDLGAVLARRTAALVRRPPGGPPELVARAGRGGHERAVPRAVGRRPARAPQRRPPRRARRRPPASTSGWQVRSRLPGRHPRPAPRIDERHVTALQVDLDRPTPVFLDGDERRPGHRAVDPRRAGRPRLRRLTDPDPQVGSAGGPGHPQGPPQARGGGPGRTGSSRRRTRSTSTPRRTTRSTSPTTSSPTCSRRRGSPSSASAYGLDTAFVARAGTARPDGRGALRVRRPPGHRARLRAQHHRHRRPGRRAGRGGAGRGGRRPGRDPRHPGRGGRRREDPDGPRGRLRRHRRRDDGPPGRRRPGPDGRDRRPGADRHLHRARPPTRRPSRIGAATRSTPPCSATSTSPRSGSTSCPTSASTASSWRRGRSRTSSPPGRSPSGWCARGASRSLAPLKARVAGVPRGGRRRRPAARWRSRGSRSCTPTCSTTRSMVATLRGQRRGPRAHRARADGEASPWSAAPTWAT